MTITLRICLVAVSLLTAAWIVREIKKAKIKIEDTVFWIGFSILLILLSVFPGIVVWGSTITGVQSPANFIFLVIIFVLLVKLFRMTVRISQLEHKLQTLTQTVAIQNFNKRNDDQ